MKKQKLQQIPKPESVLRQQSSELREVHEILENYSDQAIQMAAEEVETQ